MSLTSAVSFPGRQTALVSGLDQACRLGTAALVGLQVVSGNQQP